MSARVKQKASSVGFVILSWNGAHLLKQCLKSLESQTFTDFCVCLVDNGSTDETQKVFRDSNLEDKIVIKNAKNRGFAPAVNQGIRQLLDHGVNYIVLLNNDAALDSKWLATMLHHMEGASATLGYAQGSNFTDSSKAQYDSTGIYLEEGFIPRQKTDTSPLPRPIGPNGAALLMRRDFVEDMSYKGDLLDSSFFAYVEDVDLLLRAYLRGWEFGFFKDAHAIHIGSATGNRISSKKMYWGARNMIWLLMKDVPIGVGIKKLKKITASHLADIEFLYRTDRKLMRAYCRGTLVGIIKAPLFLLKRRQIMKARVKSNEDLIGILTPSNPPLTNPLKYIRRKLFA